jgi:hypothetical protein
MIGTIVRTFFQYAFTLFAIFGMRKIENDLTSEIQDPRPRT